jgi:hypothetical protein
VAKWKLPSPSVHGILKNGACFASRQMPTEDFHRLGGRLLFVDIFPMANRNDQECFRFFFDWKAYPLIYANSLQSRERAAQFAMAAEIVLLANLSASVTALGTRIEASA